MSASRREEKKQRKSVLNTEGWRQRRDGEGGGRSREEAVRGGDGGNQNLAPAVVGVNSFFLNFPTITSDFQSNEARPICIEGLNTDLQRSNLWAVETQVCTTSQPVGSGDTGLYNVATCGQWRHRSVQRRNLWAVETQVCTTSQPVGSGDTGLYNVATCGQWRHRSVQRRNLWAVETQVCTTSQPVGSGDTGLYNVAS
nr:hemocyanin-like 1 (Hcl-1) gene [Biomphalaria glabrata]